MPGQSPKRVKPVRAVPIGDRILTTSAVSAELQDYVDTLLGRQLPPADFGELTLYEIAAAYYERGKEIEMALHRAEREGKVKRGDPFYKLRTGELRSFLELAQSASELGSRRVTVAQMEQRMREV